MATTDLVTKKINYTLEKKAEICELLGLTGNPTWNQILAILDGAVINSKVRNVVWSFNRTTRTTTISWDAPYLPLLSDKNLSLSYYVYVNGNTTPIITTNRSVDITSGYILDGVNSVEIVVRLSSDSCDEKISSKNYVISDYFNQYSFTFDSNSNLEWILNSGKVPYYGNKIYFHYADRNWRFLGTINSTTKNIDVEFNTRYIPIYNSSGIVCDNKKTYVFKVQPTRNTSDGRQPTSIAIYDWETNTSEILSDLLPTGYDDTMPVVCKKGNKIYYYFRDKRGVFDIVNKTSEYEQYSFDELNFGFLGGEAVANGDYIYYMGRYGSIANMVYHYGLFKINPTTNGIEKILSDEDDGFNYSASAGILWYENTILYAGYSRELNPTTNLTELKFRLMTFNTATETFTIIKTIIQSTNTSDTSQDNTSHVTALIPNGDAVYVVNKAITLYITRELAQEE